MLIFTDTESNGLPDYKRPADDPDQPRIASLCTILTTNDLRILDLRYSLVAPDGWEMTAESTAINGLTDEMLLARGRPIAEVMQHWNDLLDTGSLVIGHNIRHDMKLIRGELRRLELPDRFDQTTIYCTQGKSMGLCRIPLGDGTKRIKTPTLIEAHTVLCGMAPAGEAHHGFWDTLALIPLYKAILERRALTEGLTD